MKQKFSYLKGRQRIGDTSDVVVVCGRLSYEHMSLGDVTARLPSIL